MIAGELENVQALPFGEQDDLEAYGQRAREMYAAMPEGSIVLFDLFSGTPFNQMMARCEGMEVEGLCGLSLPMLLDALSMREFLSGGELVQALAESARAGVVDVGEFMHQALEG